MPFKKYSIRGIIISILLGMILLSTLVMLYVITNFQITAAPNTSMGGNPFMWFALLAVFLVIFFMVFIALFNKLIFEPIFAMRKAAEQIRAGNLNYPIDYTHADEIGEFCSEFDKMRIRLRDTIYEQHEIEKRRKRFIASIAHDLRTPLTSIVGYVEALQDGIVKDQETYETYLSTIHDKATTLNHLIDDLSVYSREALGEFSVNPERISSGKLLNTYFSHKKEEFERGPIQLVLREPFISAYIHIDPYRFNQILDNLIGNAKKYARSLIEVHTYVEHYRLHIAISDDGEGIPEDLRNSIFDPFFMVNKVKDRRHKGGSGLGLAIVKQLTEKQDGHIAVADNTYLGATFILDFPIDR